PLSGLRARLGGTVRRARLLVGRAGRRRAPDDARGASAGVALRVVGGGGPQREPEPPESLPGGGRRMSGYLARVVQQHVAPAVGAVMPRSHGWFEPLLPSIRLPWPE